MDDDRGAHILPPGHPLVTGPSPSLLPIHDFAGYYSYNGVNRRKRQWPLHWFVSQLAVGPESIY
jgi:hypothetical protein